jgi:flavin-binding protein dodecin
MELGIDKRRERTMSVAKVTEITSESPKNFEDAIAHGIERASRTLKNIQNVWVKEQQVVIKNNKPDRYRVNMKVTFLLEE